MRSEKEKISEGKEKSENIEESEKKEIIKSESGEKYIFYAKERNLKYDFLVKRVMVLIRLREVLLSKINLNPYLLVDLFLCCMNLRIFFFQ